MIGDVRSRDLSSGRVPFEMIADANVRSAVMRLNDNVEELKKQLKEALRAINELRRRS